MIEKLIMDRVVDGLTYFMIDSRDPSDPAIPGLIQIGPLQDDPGPDEARISITIHHNDPDEFVQGTPTQTNRQWGDEIYREDGVPVIEIGGAVTWDRRFVIKARVLLESTREQMDAAQEIAATVKQRIEDALLSISFGSIVSGSETVTRGAISGNLFSELLQGGGPPDSYDFLIKIRFSVLTTRVG